MHIPEGEGFERLADGVIDVIDGPGRSLAQQSFEFGEDLLDGVQVRGVFGQEEQLGAGLSNGPANTLALVRAEIVEDDDVARLEGGHEELLDIGQEALAIDRAAALRPDAPARSPPASFFVRDALTPQEPAHHAGIGLHPARLGKTPAHLLQRDVGLLGP